MPPVDHAGLVLIVVEYSAQSLAAHDATVRSRVAARGFKEPVREPLMVALRMTMDDATRAGEARPTGSPSPGFSSRTAYEAFRESVQFGAASRQLHALGSSTSNLRVQPRSTEELQRQGRHSLPHSPFRRACIEQKAAMFRRDPPLRTLRGSWKLNVTDRGRVLSFAGPSYRLRCLSRHQL